MDEELKVVVAGCNPAAGTIDSVGSIQMTTNSEVPQGAVQEEVEEPRIDYLWLADEEVVAVEESSCGSADGLSKEAGVQGYTAASNPD